LRRSRGAPLSPTENCVVNDWNLELGFTKHLRAFFFWVSFGCCSQNDDDPHEDDLANFGYKINMKVKYLTNILLYTIFLATYLNHIYIVEIWRFFLNFGRSMAIENLNKKHMILALYMYIYFLALPSSS
jgi:hypothetical protein